MVKFFVTAFSSHEIFFVPIGSDDPEIEDLWHRIARTYSYLTDDKSVKVVIALGYILRHSSNILIVLHH